MGERRRHFHDTADFVGESIRRLVAGDGVEGLSPSASAPDHADAGGSGGYRSRLWKVALQRLASDLDLRISVCHFPPGTSKWNKIEHRMFCHITQNWRGKPLRSRAIVVNLISNTTTKAGLQIQAELDADAYKTGRKVSDEEFAAIRLEKASFHGEWNYTIAPKV